MRRWNVNGKRRRVVRSKGRGIGENVRVEVGRWRRESMVGSRGRRARWRCGGWDGSDPSVERETFVIPVERDAR